MSSDNTPLGDRMKAYENVHRRVIRSNSCTVVRVDGRAFHSYLRGCKRPFDEEFVAHMNEVAQELCIHTQTALLAYVQSDEVSLLLTDYETPQKQPAYGGVEAKLISLSASIATATLNRLRPDGRAASFDARVFTLPNVIETVNYLMWRQWDAKRNAVSMIGRAYFSHKELYGKSGNDIQEMLFQQHGVNIMDFDQGLRFGRVVVRQPSDGERPVWTVQAAPEFTCRPDGWLASVIPAEPAFFLPGD